MSMARQSANPRIILAGRDRQGELFVKDAFLVFRALCKLTMKPLLTER